MWGAMQTGDLGLCGVDGKRHQTHAHLLQQTLRLFSRLDWLIKRHLIYRCVLIKPPRRVSYGIRCVPVKLNEYFQETNKNTAWKNEIHVSIM